jgi:hypothetical protein
MAKRLSRALIRRLLKSLNDELAREGVFGEVYLVGGAVMCLVFKARKSTRDVDAVFEPKTRIREAARRVAARHDVPEKWLSDAVKGFLSEKGTFDPYLALSHLTVFTAPPEYLLAMKCLSFRLGKEYSDEEDVRYLLRYLNIEVLEEALDLITRYYPEKMIPQKAYYALQQILEQQGT